VVADADPEMVGNARRELAKLGLLNGVEHESPVNVCDQEAYRRSPGLQPRPPSGRVLHPPGCGDADPQWRHRPERLGTAEGVIREKTTTTRSASPDSRLKVKRTPPRSSADVRRACLVGTLRGAVRPQEALDADPGVSGSYGKYDGSQGGRASRDESLPPRRER
jgi:hypothetical protein